MPSPGSSRPSPRVVDIVASGAEASGSSAAGPNPEPKEGAASNEGGREEASGADDFLGQALAGAEAALALARRDEWDQVAAQDARCRELIRKLSAESGQIDPARLADGLARIREHYRELLSMAAARRDRLADAVRVSVRGRAGTRAYEQNR